MTKPPNKTMVKEAKKKYNKLKKKSIFSPALNRHVRFTNRGWNHMFHSGKSSADVKRRLFLIDFIKPVVSKTRKYKDGQTGSNCYIIEGVHTRQYRSRPKKRRVRVVILKDVKKKYVFLSVSDCRLY